MTAWEKVNGERERERGVVWGGGERDLKGEGAREKREREREGRSVCSKSQ